MTIASDHITATRPALAQLPKEYRRGRRILIRTDSADGTHTFLAWLAQRWRWLSHAVGTTVTEQVHSHVPKVPAFAWTPDVETGGEIRDGAWIAELTGDALPGRPKGRRLIVRKDRRHRGSVEDHRRGRHAADLLRHQRHRPDRPPPAPHRAKQDLAGDRADHPRPARLEPMLALTGEARR